MGSGLLLNLDAIDNPQPACVQSCYTESHLMLAFVSDRAGHDNGSVGCADTEFGIGKRGLRLDCLLDLLLNLRC
jgi:hypothetical protein